MVWVTKAEPLPKPARLEAVLSVKIDTSSHVPFGHWLHHIRPESLTPVLIPRATHGVGYTWGGDRNRQFPKPVIRVDEVLGGHPAGIIAAITLRGDKSTACNIMKEQNPGRIIRL